MIRFLRRKLAALFGRKPKQPVEQKLVRPWDARNRFQFYRGPKP